MGRFSDLRKKAKEKEKSSVKEEKIQNKQEHTTNKSKIYPTSKTDGKSKKNIPLPSSGLAEDILSDIIQDKEVFIQEDSLSAEDKFARIDREEKIKESLLQFIIFSLDDEKYAIEIFSVTEIIPPKKITRVPKLPKHIKGVINIRGIVIPIIDLRDFFDLPKKEYDKNTRYIIIENNNRKIAITVDKVYNVANIAIEKIDTIPIELKRNIGSENLTGITNIDSDAVAILDIEKIINIKENKGGKHES